MAKMTGMWRNQRLLAGKWHEDVLELHKKIGRVVRIAPIELSIVDEETFRRLYGRGSRSRRTEWYNGWATDPAAPGMFATQDEKLHSFLRERVSKAYSSCLDVFLRKLVQHAEAGHVINTSLWTSALAFDVVGELAFGTSFGMLDSESDVMGLCENTSQILATMANLGHYPGQAGAVRCTTLSQQWCARVMSIPTT
ncbi:hypothetical protein LTR70_007339 [Exophiala xenobiotica]|nr:hypothetical protein LTR70_007339 [Exophiala xenobiotica]